MVDRNTAGHKRQTVMVDRITAGHKTDSRGGQNHSWTQKTDSRGGQNHRRTGESQDQQNRRWLAMSHSHDHTHMAFVLTTIQLVVRAMTFSVALTSALNVGNTAMLSKSINNARVLQPSGSRSQLQEPMD